MAIEDIRPPIMSFETGSISRVWGNRFSLQIDNLSFDAGSSYAVLGANGSGKSTLLRILAEKMLGSSACQSPGKIGYLPQNPHCFNLTVEESIKAGISPSFGLSSEDQDRFIDEIMNKLDLSHLRNARANKLSGGEAQRVALARLLVVDRDVLLLDEPTKALDLQGMSLADKTISEYVRKTGCTFVLVTHQLSLAERLCENVIFLDNGRLDSTGSLINTLRQAKSPSLRQYLYYEMPEYMDK